MENGDFPQQVNLYKEEGGGRAFGSTNTFVFGFFFFWAGPNNYSSAKIKSNGSLSDCTLVRQNHPKPLPKSSSRMAKQFP